MTARPPFLAVLSAVPVLVGLATFSSSGRDDTHITFWAARSLSRSGEILNYSGDRVEQSSSLLHTVILASLERVTPWSLPVLGLLVGLVAAAATVVLTGLLAERIRAGTGQRAALLVATMTYVAYWAVGGLETVLAAALYLGAALSWHRVLAEEPRVATVVAATGATLATLAVRPEAPLVLAAAVIGLAVGAWRDGLRPIRRRVGLLAIVVALGSVALVALRLVYFDALVPQPATSKVGGLEVVRGLRYVWIWSTTAPAIALLLGGVAAIGLRALWSSAGRDTWLVLSFAAAGVAFVVTSGGDWMEGGRLLVPALPFLAVVVATRASPMVTPFVALLVVLQLVGTLTFARAWSTGVPLVHADTMQERAHAVAESPVDWPDAVNRVHIRDLPMVTRVRTAVDAVTELLGHPPLVVSGQAGMVAFELASERPGSFRFVDLGGLTTAELAEGCPTAIQRTLLGAAVSYRDWFEDPAACGVGLPDIVFGLGDPPAEIQERFVTVFRTEGDIASPGRLLPGARVSGVAYLAVRSDLAGRLAWRPDELGVLDFSELDGDA